MSTAPVTCLDEPYLPRLRDVPFQPVFVIGPHRSGTTILCRVLIETGCFNFVTVYHLINRERLLSIHHEGRTQQAREDLTRLFDSKHVTDREIDFMPVTPDLPEEYCYALTPPARRPMLNDRNLPGFIEFCKKIQAIQDPSRPLLLKNPYDTVNFLYLSRTFQEARFVFIHRNPVEVVNSQVRAVLSLLRNKNEYVALLLERYRKVWTSPMKLKLGQWLYGENLPFLVNSVAHHVSRNCDYILKNLGALGGRAAGVTYAELCRRPQAVTPAILNFLQLESARCLDYASLIQPREPKLLPCVARRQEAIRRRNAEYCRQFQV